VHGGLVQCKRAWWVARGAGEVQEGLVGCMGCRCSAKDAGAVQEGLVGCKRDGDKMRMMLTDTDSLQYLIETEDLYADLRVLKKLKHLTYDVSDAKPWHPLYDPNPETNNKKYPGAFKDTSVETGIQIGHVGLKAKLYADRFVDIRAKTESSIRR
jgi:hypothetical protein